MACFFVLFLFQVLGSLSCLVHNLYFSLCSSLCSKTLLYRTPLICSWSHPYNSLLYNFSSLFLLWLQEYKSIARMRLVHIRQSPNPSHFTVLVRSIPKSPEESYSDSVRKFFQKYHSSSYLSHQMIYKTGKVQKIMVRISCTLFLMCTAYNYLLLTCFNFKEQRVCLSFFISMTILQFDLLNAYILFICDLTR